LLLPPISTLFPYTTLFRSSHSGSTDKYYKGANMLHTLRQILDNDEKWRQILIGLNKTFYHQTFTSKQVEDYISKKSDINLTTFFDQYLRTTKIPKVEYAIENNKLKFRYTDIIENFEMPVIMLINGKEEWIKPTSKWKTKEFPTAIKTTEVKKDFYVYSEQV